MCNLDNLKSKEILVAILNRNDPDKGDSLHKFFLKNNYKNIFLLENGTEITNTSKNFNKRIIPTKGVAWGVNYICKVFQKSSFNFLWLNFNDVKFKNFEIAENWILKKLLEKKNGVVVPDWVTWSTDISSSEDKLVYNFDPISFLISKDCLNSISKSSSCNPLYDSKNFTNHYNTMLTSEKVLKNNYLIISSKIFSIYEENVSQNESTITRGFSDYDWKNNIGIKFLKEFLYRNYNWDTNLSHKLFRKIYLNKLRSLFLRKTFKLYKLNLKYYYEFIKSHFFLLKNFIIVFWIK